MDVARRIQLTKTKHENATRNYKALCEYVDREGSPLHALVLECYPSGSFATGTAILSHVKSNQHDVDVVIELDIHHETEPATVLEALFEAINGEPGSRYHGKVRKNSRCVTVHYDDGTSVDLMPVARFPGGPLRAGKLFHHKGADQFHKEVNPWAFKEHFNRQVEYDANFHELFKARRLLVESALEIKAETQPMPDHIPVEEKSARVVALQLIKRNRDIEYRAVARKDLRKPPAVALAAVSLEAGPVHSSLTDEVINVANTIRTRLMSKDGPRGVIHIVNPPHPRDVFSDRWPENPTTQDLYNGDLRRLVVDLHRLKSDGLSFEEKKAILKRLFGETAASYAIESVLDVRRAEMEANRLHMGPSGRAATGAVAAPAIATGLRTNAARAATREGGGFLEDN
jgi:hypothetical protein